MRREEQLDNLMADVTAQKREVERLTAENAKLQDSLASMKSESLQHHHAWMCEMELRKEEERRVREMGEHAAALRNALLRFGDHSPNCPGRENPEACQCGWMVARNRVPGDPVVDQVGKYRELLRWIKRNHNGYPDGHSLCPVCKAIDQALAESRCPQIHPFGRCDREAGHWGLCAAIQMRSTDQMG